MPAGSPNLDATYSFAGMSSVEALLCSVWSGWCPATEQSGLVRVRLKPGTTTSLDHFRIDSYNFV